MHGPNCDRFDGWKTSASALTKYYVQMKKDYYQTKTTIKTNHQSMATYVARCDGVIQNSTSRLQSVPSDVDRKKQVIQDILDTIMPDAHLSLALGDSLPDFF